MKMFLLLLVLILCIVPVGATDWHEDTRAKRVQLNVNNSSVALTDYQLMKTITYDSDMQPDFDDILFYNESGGNVSYWIESKTDSVSADIWLKIPSISTTEGAQVWMYYDNSSVSSASSISDTFIDGSVFDDLTGWTQQAGTWSVSSGLLHSPTSDSAYLRRNTPITESSYIVTTRAMTTNNLRFTTIVEANNPMVIQASLAGCVHSNTNGFDLRVDWSWSPTAETFNDDTFYISEIDVISGSNVMRVYDGDHNYLDETPTRSDSSGSGNRWGFFASGDVNDHDWIHVRKYTATEPTWGEDGEEESYEEPPVPDGVYLYPNSMYSVGCYGRLISELVYETGFNYSDIDSCNALTTENMEVLSTDDTNYIPSIDKDSAHDGYMYGNFSLPGVKTVNFINVKTVHNRNETNPVILGLFNVSTQKWHAVNNSSVEIIDVELTYNITGTDIIKYSTLIDNTLNLSVSLNTNGDGNYDVFVDFVEVYIDYEESPDITLGYVYNLTISNQNNISVLQNDVGDLENNVNNLYLFVLLCTVFLIVISRKGKDEQ